MHTHTLEMIELACDEMTDHCEALASCVVVVVALGVVAVALGVFVVALGIVVDLVVVIVFARLERGSGAVTVTVVGGYLPQYCNAGA